MDAFGDAVVVLPVVSELADPLKSVGVGYSVLTQILYDVSGMHVDDDQRV